MQPRVLAIALTVAAMALPVGAIAHTVRFETEVRITKVGQVTKRGTNAFRGVVRSERAGCERERLVKLFYDDEGPNLPVEQGSDTTNENGRFYIEIQVFPPGKYFVKATRVERGGPGHTHVCKPDRSKAYNREL